MAMPETPDISPKEPGKSPTMYWLSHRILPQLICECAGMVQDLYLDVPSVQVLWCCLSTPSNLHAAVYGKAVRLYPH